MIDKLECDYGICKHEVFQDKKCIFHCDKEDNEKWGKPTKYVDEFWEALFIHIKKEEEDSTKEAILLTHYKFPYSLSDRPQININKRMEFYCCIFLYDITFDANSFSGKLNFSYCQIQNIFLLKQKTKDERFLFKDLEFSNCKFTENSDIVLKNLDINKLKISNNINNTQRFLLTNVTINKELHLQSMFLKAFYFHNFDLTNTKCYFQHLYFDDVVFNKINWGKNLQTRFYDEKNEVNKADREIARQIKYTYDTQGDKINANKFHALEKALYKAELQKDNDASQQEKIIFNIENIVSEHGQNFLLPLFWIFFFGSIFTLFKSLDLKNGFLLIIPMVFIMIYNIDFDKLYYKICFYSLSAIMILYILYLKSDCFFEMIDITKGSEPIDFIFKILFLFLSYQFVMAVRKDTKR